MAIAAVVLGAAAMPAAAQLALPPGWLDINFRDAILNGKSLAEQHAHIRMLGVYEGASPELGLLYSIDHKPVAFEDSVRLLLDGAPHEVQELLYDCRRRSGQLLDRGNLRTNACPVRVEGRFTTCHLKINNAANFPCLAVEKIELLKPQR